MGGGILRQIIRFGTVGIGATLVHLAVAWLANHSAGLAPYGANAAGFAAAFTLSYLGHFFWTFARRAGHRRHLPRFLVVSAMGYGLTNAVVWLVIGRMGGTFDAALAVILVTVPPTTWVLSRLWAFRMAG